MKSDINLRYLAIHKRICSIKKLYYLIELTHSGVSAILSKFRDIEVDIKSKI